MRLDSFLNRKHVAWASGVVLLILLLVFVAHLRVKPAPKPPCSGLILRLQYAEPLGWYACRTPSIVPRYTVPSGPITGFAPGATGPARYTLGLRAGRVSTLAKPLLAALL